MIKQGQWFKGKDFELHCVEDEWVLTLNQLGEQQVLPLELMLAIHFAIQENYLKYPYYEDKVRIQAVVDWMNEWEQLKGTSIPIRFKEDFTSQLKEPETKSKWYQFWK